MVESGEFADLRKEEIERFSAFLRSLPLYYETGEHLLVHAGFDFAAQNIFCDPAAMLNIRQFNYNGEKAGGKKVLHGHLPVPLGDIIKAVKAGGPVLPLDNGCVYRGERVGMGNLCCLELKQMRLITIENEDKKSL